MNFNQISSSFGFCLKHILSADSLLVKRLFSTSVHTLHKNQASSQQETSNRKLYLSNPTGTRDYGPAQTIIREKVIETIKTCFKRHGAMPIDTPIFQFKEFLEQRYGEEHKQIYEVINEGRQSIALRYDLTVPLARYLAMSQISKQKCYQIAKVYRKDDPIMKKGRYREFFQCDFDIAGAYDHMSADAECFRVLWEVLSELDIGNFIIKINDRRILDGIFEVTGCSQDKFQVICSAIDRLDKMKWTEVKSLLLENGIEEETADEIGTFVQLKGGRELIEKLLDDPKLNTNSSIMSGLNDMEVLFDYLDIYGVSDKVSLDLSLARGLTYYTGVIYEAIITDTENVGSIAGGGRYDDLVRDFSPKDIEVPCVGFSVGIERIFSIIESRMLENDDEQIRCSGTQVYVCSPKKGYLSEKMKLLSMLWTAGIRAKMSHSDSSKLLTQLQECEKEQIPLVLIIAPRELRDGVVVVRDVATREEVKVDRERLICEVQRKLNEL